MFFRLTTSPQLYPSLNQNDLNAHRKGEEEFVCYPGLSVMQEKVNLIRNVFASEENSVRICGSEERMNTKLAHGPAIYLSLSLRGHWKTNKSSRCGSIQLKECICV